MSLICAWLCLVLAVFAYGRFRYLLVVDPRPSVQMWALVAGVNLAAALANGLAAYGIEVVR